MDVNESEKSLDSVFPGVATLWRRVACDMLEIYRMPMRATSGLRSVAMQWAIYGKGRSKLPNGTWIISDASAVVSYSEPFKSWHNYGLAIDACFTGKDPYLEQMLPERAQFLWNEYGRFLKAHGLEWGGDFHFHPDRPHAQMRYGMSLGEARSLYEFGGLKAVFHKCEKISKGEK